MAMSSSAPSQPAAAPPRRRVWPAAVSALVLLLIVMLLADAFVAPSAHDVHSPGGTALAVHRFDSIQGKFWWTQGPPTQTLAEVQCSTGTPYRSDPTCSGAGVAQYYPTLAQSAGTLYVVWPGCQDWSGAGAVIPWQGYNVEYFSSNRTL